MPNPNPWNLWIYITLHGKSGVKWKLLSCVQLFATPWTSPWNSPGQNTGVGSLSLFRGIFPTQGSKTGLLHCRWILYQLSHKGSWRILEWVAYPFSSRSSWPRTRTGVSCIAGRFFTNWANQEALHCKRPFPNVIRLRILRWRKYPELPMFTQCNHSHSFIYIYIHIYVYMYMCIYMYLCIYVYIYTYVCMCIFISLFLFIYLAVLGLSCGRWDLLVVATELLVAARSL